MTKKKKGNQTVLRDICASQEAKGLARQACCITVSSHGNQSIPGETQSSLTRPQNSAQAFMCVEAPTQLTTLKDLKAPSPQYHHTGDQVSGTYTFGEQTIILTVTKARSIHRISKCEFCVISPNNL